ncbi:helix-turn-helix domain-containing protein [Streptomyces sp. SCSIO 30461]|uniref:PucR family transcriptional regulator n=1 Tax=Streptomyces sp. SCSIO 30461 TaxID=3118085 RepID=UPI0030CB59D0
MISERERVAAELVADPRAAERVVQRIVDAVHREVPAYTALDGSRLPELRAIAAWALERLLRLWADGGELGPADLRRFRGIAAARAADGRPVQAVLRAYRVAAAVVVDEIAAHAPRLTAGDAFALTRQLLAALDTLAEVMATAYATASEHLAGDRDRALRLLLDDLIAGRHASVGALTDRAVRLDIQLPDPYCLLVAEPVEPTGLIEPTGPGGPGGSGVREGGPYLTQDAASGLLAALTTPRTGGSTSLATTRGPRAVLLLPADAIGGAPGALRERGWRGCAVGGESLDRIAVAHRLASDALDTAPAHAHHPERILTEADAHVLALLAGHPAAAPDRIGRLVLGPLAHAGQRHLLVALTAYVDTGSATAAARALHLHPQSLRYRLRRIRELTGRDPRDPWQRLTLDIARTVMTGFGSPAGA